ncbi:MAG TPA: hypothetical protein VII55_00685 [Candidatus Saccharimonadales bacterium]
MAAAPGQEPIPGIKPQVFEPIEIDQLFTAGVPEGQGEPDPHSVWLRNRAWGKLNGAGGSDVIGLVGDDPEGHLREERRLLVGALCTFGNFSPFDVMDVRLGRALQELNGDKKQSEEESEKPIGEVDDGDSLTAFQGLKAQVRELQARYRAGRSEDLNHFIEDGESEIMASVVEDKRRFSPGQIGLKGYVVLHGVSLVGLDEKSWRPIAQPVISGRDGKLSLLPEGHAVKNLFVEAA